MLSKTTKKDFVKRMMTTMTCTAAKKNMNEKSKKTTSTKQTNKKNMSFIYSSKQNKTHTLNSNMVMHSILLPQMLCLHWPGVNNSRSTDTTTKSLYWKNSKPLLLTVPEKGVKKFKMLILCSIP